MAKNKEETRTERERKAELRRKWRAEGWTEITLRVAVDQVAAVRDFVATLPGPKDKPNPDQMPLPLEGLQ